MAIQRWDPVRELTGLQQKMNRLFDETFSRSTGTAGDDAGSAGWRPSMDLFEEADRYVMRADLPGVVAGDVEIKIDDGTLHLTGERKIDGDVSRDSYLRVERPYGRFTLQISLAPSVDTSTIRATHGNGVIEIVMPKRSRSEPSTIQVSTR